MQGSSRLTAFRAGLLPLGWVPYDGFVLPLISPDGRYIATETNTPPAWSAVLAEAGASPPYATTVEIYRLDTRLTIKPEERLVAERIGQVSTPVLLGRGSDVNGFLVEAPQEDGSRWIGKVAWEGGDVRWLVQGEMVNAFAALAPDGRLAWSRRAKDAERFDLVVRDIGGQEWTVPGNGGDWLMPVWSTSGNGVYAMHRQNRQLRLCYGQATGQAIFQASQREFLLIANSDKYAAYQAFIGQGSLDGADGSEQPQILFLHPSLGRMAIWKPTSPKGATAVQLNAHSLAALQQSAITVIICLRDEVLLQSLRQPDSHVRLSTGTWVPRRTTHWDFPYVLLSPDEGRVHITALKLMTPESASPPAGSGTPPPR